MSLKLYGIKNCDSVKKAIKYLNENNRNFEFYDLKEVLLETEQLKKWIEENPNIINKRSTTYRQLKEKIDQASEVELIQIAQENPTLLKRPIVIDHDRVIVGFVADYYK